MDPLEGGGGGGVCKGQLTGQGAKNRTAGDEPGSKKRLDLVGPAFPGRRSYFLGAIFPGGIRRGSVILTKGTWDPRLPVVSQSRIPIADIMDKSFSNNSVTW